MICLSLVWSDVIFVCNFVCLVLSVICFDLSCVFCLVLEWIVVLVFLRLWCVWFCLLCISSKNVDVFIVDRVIVCLWLVFFVVNLDDSGNVLVIICGDYLCVSFVISVVNLGLLNRCDGIVNWLLWVLC